MAGIAFRLQKLIDGESYTDLIRAYLYSALISTGPFIMVMLILGFLRYISSYSLNPEQTNITIALIIYLYAFSMIGTAPFFYVVTRYLADRYYLKEVESFTPSYLSVLFTCFFVESCIGGTYLYFLSLPISIKWILFTLLLLISGIWIAMIYLSAGKSYIKIVYSFALSTIFSFIAVFYLGSSYGMEGFILGFTIGQALCFFLLTVQIFREFGYESAYNFGFFSYFFDHPYLILIGILYYAGIWVDKFLFWFSKYGEPLLPNLNIFTQYDAPIFLAYITIIPSMAFFLVQMETSFVKKYHAYYQSIRNRSSLQDIEDKRNKMVDDISNNFQKFAIFQGIISCTIILSLYWIIETLGLNPSQFSILRIGILGAFLQMAFVIILNIIFYFDFQKEAFIICCLYFSTNLIFTWVSIQIGLPAFGFGYTLSCLVTVMGSFFILNKKLKNIDYFTFMNQPIIIPKFNLEIEQNTQNIQVFDEIN